MTQIKYQCYSGFCLCESVKFEFFVKNIRTIYRCYCRLCRRQSGSASNASLLILSKHFDWLQGQEFIQKFQKPTGFTSHFCQHCGSPVPNALSALPHIMWIPLGLVEENFSVERELAFCISSAASWSGVNNPKRDIEQFDQLPNWNELEEKFDLKSK